MKWKLVLTALSITNGLGCVGSIGDDDTTPSQHPDPNYCNAESSWSAEWTSFEEQVLTFVNQYRAQGANCGSKGVFASAAPLTMQAQLRCAARLHAKDMVDRNFFDHYNPDGESPWDRFAKAGYSGYSSAAENIASGQTDAASVMSGWMASDGHCANIMNGDFDEIGVGYYTDGVSHSWTQTFGKR